MESFWIAVAWIVVLGGGAWAGAKAAFFTTLFFKVLFGKASEPTPQPQPQVQPQPQIVYVPMYMNNAGFGGHAHYDWDDRDGFMDWDEGEVIDVTPRR